MRPKQLVKKQIKFLERELEQKILSVSEVKQMESELKRWQKELEIYHENKKNDYVQA